MREPDTRPRALFVDRFTPGDGRGAQAPHYRRMTADGGIGFAGTVRRRHACARPSPSRAIGSPSAIASTSLQPGRFETELNLAMPSCDGFLGRYLLEGEVRGGFGQPLGVEGMTVIRLEDGVLGGSLTVQCEPPADLEARPLHTVSQSEAGFEKIMQAATLSLAWSLPGGASEVQVVISIAKGGVRLAARPAAGTRTVGRHELSQPRGPAAIDSGPQERASCHRNASCQRREVRSPHDACSRLPGPVFSRAVAALAAPPPPNPYPLSVPERGELAPA